MTTVNDYERHAGHEDVETWLCTVTMDGYIWTLKVKNEKGCRWRSLLLVLVVNTGIVPLNWQLPTFGGDKEGEDQGGVQWKAKRQG